MRIGRWIKDRWPISAMLYWGLHEPIAGGPRFAYVFGSTTLFLFLLQVMTGMWQLFYYVPTVDHAYASVSYLRLQVPFGWLIHGMHYWGASAFLVVMGLHLGRVFIWGAYKKPRELTWLIGVLLLLLGAAMMFTGATLPWDLMGYWAGQVGLSIAGTVPLIGNFLKSVLEAGSSMDQLTLMRFFVLHVAILPALTALLIFAHIVAFRQFGSTGPWRAEKRQRTGWFWPEQAFRDLLVAAAVFVLLIGLSAYVRAPITGPADPLDQTYTPKPEWNFLFLYQALKQFKGHWEDVGTVGIPLLLVLLLILPPSLDRSEERNPRKRPLAMICGLLFAGGILSLTVLGYLSGPASLSVPGAALGPTQPSGTRPLSMPSPPMASIKAGHELFVSRGCSACHSTTGQPGLGPNLSDEARRGSSRQWLVVQIRNPKAHNADTIMPPFRTLSLEQVNDLVDYLLSLSGPAPGTQPGTGAAIAATMPSSQPLPPLGALGPAGPAANMIGSAYHGRTLYNRYCAYCHGKPEGAAVISTPAPSLAPINRELYSPDPAVFAQNIDRIIQHGIKPRPESPGPAMPDFGDSDSLTQPQIANIEAYVLHLNNVDRAKILHPGVAPGSFFWIAVLAFAAVALVLGGSWLALSRRRHS